MARSLRDLAPVLTAVAVIMAISASGAAVGSNLADGDEDGVRIAFLGDSGTGSAQQHEVARRVAEADDERDFDWLVLLGDMIYEDGDPALIDERVISPYQDTLDGGTALVPVLGNHDVRLGQGDVIMDALGAPGRWYALTTDLVQLIVLDSTRPHDPEQLAFLAQTLEDSTSEWLVVSLHHPPYSAGRHGSDADARKAFVPFFTEFGVDLVMSGHEHDYQRSHRVDGVTYVISGAGGQHLRETGTAEFTAFSASVPSFVSVSVEPGRLSGEAYGLDGIIDRFELTPQPPRATGIAAGYAQARARSALSSASIMRWDASAPLFWF